MDYFLVATEVDPFDGCLLLLVDILRLGDLLPDLLLLVELPEAIDGELPAYVPFDNLGPLGQIHGGLLVERGLIGDPGKVGFALDAVVCGFGVLDGGAVQPVLLEADVELCHRQSDCLC